MKSINASLIPLGKKERVQFSLIELMVESKIDLVNKIILKRGVPYSLDSLQWEITDATIDIEQPAEAAQSTLKKDSSNNSNTKKK